MTVALCDQHFYCKDYHPAFLREFSPLFSNQLNFCRFPFGNSYLTCKWLPSEKRKYTETFEVLMLGIPQVSSVRSIFVVLKRMKEKYDNFNWPYRTIWNHPRQHQPNPIAHQYSYSWEVTGGLDSIWKYKIEPVYQIEDIKI